VSLKKTYKSFGRTAILIEWEAKVEDVILKDITLFKQKLIHAISDNIVDVIIGYHTLVIKYNKDINSLVDEIQRLKSIYNSSVDSINTENFLWEIPVCYDAAFGVDLELISERNKLTIPEIIKLHTQQIYTVYFIGFLPGFLYLAGLNEKLCIPRKETPRLKVAKGSVAIGGQQTGIYPSESAGGWSLIGKTPISFFEVKRENPCFAKGGDKIKFISISMKDFLSLKENRVSIKRQPLL